MGLRSNIGDHHSPRHVAVILPAAPAALAVKAKLVGLDCGLNQLARRMKCAQCEGRRVTVRAVEPGCRSASKGLRQQAPSLLLLL